MSFNEDELLKIKNKTSGFFGKQVRLDISACIYLNREKINAAKDLDEPARAEALKLLMNNFTERRKRALADGARSYKDRRWACPAVMESWLHELLGGDEQGIKRVEGIIDELERRALQ